MSLAQIEAKGRWGGVWVLELSCECGNKERFEARRRAGTSSQAQASGWVLYSFSLPPEQRQPTRCPRCAKAAVKAEGKGRRA